MAETIHTIMGRIADATPESQIAVFRNPDGTFKSQFAAPLRTRRILEMRPPSLVGIFDQTMNQHEILAAMGYQKPHKRTRDKVTRWNRDVVPA